jgi:hypothetical protein
MANTIKIRRSAVPSAVPTTGQIALGELAVNTFDGKLFLKKNNGTESIVEIGAGGSGSGTGFTSSIDPPVSPVEGDEWFDEDAGILYTYVADGNTSQWIELGPKIYGPQGATGPAGPVGATGVIGISGATGVEGPVGATGVIGVSGATGPVGVSGATGVIGVSGATGVIGVSGATGVRGGVPYNFSTAVADSDPGTGILQYNSGTIGSVTQIFIDDVDVGSTNQTSWFATWDDSTNVSKGYITIQSALSTSTVTNIFQVTAVTPATGYYKITVTYVSGTLPANSDALVVDFVRTGDQGATGVIGVSGATGAVGASGATGVIGVSGATGVEGPIGATGIIGATGATGAGATGATGPALLGIPQSLNTTIVAADAGKYIDTTTGVTINSSTGFSVGDMCVIYNDSAANITITTSNVTLRFAGTASTGNRTLAQRGLANILCVASNEYVVSGAGLT